MKMRTKHLAVLSASTAFAALLAWDAASAGGFAIREQSAAGQGSSFAGVAAGGSLSSMFWNPAAMTQFQGRNFEADAALIFPHAAQSGTPGAALVAAGFTSGTDNSGSNAFVPSFYTSWQLSDRAWFGMSMNSPFGLSVNFQNPVWAGAVYAQSTTLETYNLSPSFAFKVTEWLSLGVGLQVQLGRANLMSLNSAGAGAANLFVINGSGWGWGWTAGATITPTPTTSIGIGYRSAIDQDINGTLSGTGGATTAGAVSTTLKLPDMVSVGLRQGLGAGWTLLGTFEWTGWSRIGTSAVTQSNGSAALAASGAAITLPFQYSDGYFYSGGLEYALNPAWTLRAGFAYEQSPITDRVRTPRLPDNDRYWYSVGATNKMTNRLSVDFGYSYIDVKDTTININAASGNPWFTGTAAGTYTGTASSYIHILSIGVKYRFDDPPKSALITK